MPRAWTYLLVLGVVVAGADERAAAQSQTVQRYLAQWSDGTRTSAAEVADWSWVDKQPRLGDRPLYDLSLIHI